MQHLTLEALARLVDEPPEAHEAAHVRDCLSCRRELDELRSLTHALAALPDPEPAPGGWAALEAVLRDEGLVRDVVPVRVAALPWYRSPRVLRAAAASALFLLGGVAGALFWGRGGADRVASTDPPARGEPVYASQPERTPGIVPVDGPLPGEEPLLFVEEQTPAAQSGVRLAAEGSAGVERRRPRRMAVEPPAPAAPRTRPAPREEAPSPAELELLQAELAYLVALQRYARTADEAGEQDPEARLAALERLVSATSAALDRAPGDPVINGYHMAALRQRDEARRQVAGQQQKNWF